MLGTIKWENLQVSFFGITLYFRSGKNTLQILSKYLLGFARMNVYFSKLVLHLFSINLNFDTISIQICQGFSALYSSMGSQTYFQAPLNCSVIGGIDTLIFSPQSVKMSCTLCGFSLYLD